MKQPLSLGSVLTWLENKLTTFLNSKYWRVKLISLALAISVGSLLLFNSIYYWTMASDFFQEIRQPGTQVNYFWDDIIRQGQQPFRSANYSGTIVPHEANLAFRLTVPLLSRFLRLNIIELYAFQLLLGLVFLWAITGLVATILEDKVRTFYFLTGFTAIYPGIAFFINYYGHCDGYTYCFLALACCFPRPLLIVLFSQLAFWCDERALINSSYLGLWFLLPTLTYFSENGRLPTRLFSPSFSALLASISIYLLVRKALEWHFNIHVGHNMATSLETLKWSLTIFGDKMTRGLEGMWIVLFVAFWILYSRRNWTFLFLVGGALMVTMLIANVVADGTRSLGFGFPIFFLALSILKNNISAKQINYILIISAFISLMLPISFP